LHCGESPGPLPSTPRVTAADHQARSTGIKPTARSRGWSWWVLAGCISGLALTSCGGSTSGTPPTTSRAAVSTTAPSPADASDQVLSAYRGMWADLVTAAATSDFQSPLLPRHATGAALSLLVQGLARDQLHDIVTRGVTLHHPRVTALTPGGDPTRATVSDCFDDTRWIEYTTSGDKAKNSPGGRRTTTADLVRSSGGWKVSQITIGATGTC
jgi:hypothetical protein